MTGRFCAECGAEQEEVPELPPIRHFVVEAVRDVTELDSQLLATIGALLGRPGELTRAFVHGPRRRYLRPLKIFFLANVLYFFAAGLTGMSTFATPLRYQITSPPAPGVKATLIARTLIEKNMDEQGLAPRWDAITDAHARTLVVLMIPLYALVYAGLLWWTRRPALYHLVFATHFMSFYLVLVSVAGAIVRTLVSLAGRGWIGEIGFSLAVLAVLAAYTSMAVRRAYDIGWATSAGVTMAATVLAFPVLLLYRFLLFLTVWAVV